MDRDTGKFDWPKKAVLQLIEMYKTHECLYNSKHKFYHNKNARYSALNAMAEKLKVFYPYIGANDVKNKITYLRGQYTREVAKMREIKSEQGADDEYIPSAYWYEHISFLADFITPRKGCDLLEQNSQVEDSRDSSHHFDIASSPAETSKRPRISYNNTPPSSQSIASNANNKPVYERDEAFSNYIKTELNEITDLNIKDQLMETMTLAIFEAKKQQKIANTNEAKFSNFDINFIN